MLKQGLFRFNSITHRLIFSFVMAAIAIYGVSYAQARQIVQKTVGAWMVDSVKSRLNLVENEINGQLSAIETSVILPIEIMEKPNTELKSKLLPVVKTVMEQQPLVRSLTLIEFPDQTFKGGSGWRYDRQVGYNHLLPKEIKIFLSRCPVRSGVDKAFWSKPYSLKDQSTSLAISYCQPLLNQGQSKGFLAIEVSLAWLSPFITKQFLPSPEINYLKDADAFILAKSTQEWIVKPSNPQRVLSWFSQENSRLLNSDLIEGKTNSQSTLMAIRVRSQDWFIGVLFPTSKLQEFQQQYLWLVIVSMSKDMVLICAVIAMISTLTTRPLRALISSTEEMAQGNLETTLPPVSSFDEVGRLTQSFGKMQNALQNQIKYLQETTAAKQKLESEISLAGQIQRTMVPRINVVNNPTKEPYSISALLKPARIVGGDLYDFFFLDTGLLCLIIGDVAGKGFPAALLMARTVTLIRTLSKTVNNPIEILNNVNIELCVNNEDCQFVTLFCGVLELESGKFCYASAGHDPPLLLQEQEVRYLDLKTGPPLGLYEDAIFTQSECLLKANNLIVLYTDGITEAMNSKGEFFSEDFLKKLLSAFPPKNTVSAIRTIVHFCQEFVGEAPQSDDMTLLAVQYFPLFFLAEAANIMKWSLTINSTLTELDNVKQSLGKILQAKSLKIELIEDAQLIVEEVLANIIEYGYDNKSDACIPIDLRVEIDGDKLILIFEDGGKPFNPLTEIVPPDLNMGDEARSLGGFGFFLVQQLAEQIDYVYRDRKNILTICQSVAFNV